MLQRRVTSTGVVYYASPLLESAGVPHAFSTRIGGISPPPFDSMNLGNPNGSPTQDDYAHIWQNYQILQNAIGCRDHPLCRVHQVHGRRIARVEPGKPFNNSAHADAIVSDDPTRMLSIRIADCVPILVAASDGRIVAAIHAGWRGLIAGVIGVAVAEMNCPIDRAIAGIGPCISGDNYEVGREVLGEFRRVFGPDAPVVDNRVDLRQAAKIQLIQAGIHADHIDMTDRCTVRDANEFFSHRRQNGLAGRMAAIIAPRQP